MPSRGSEPMDAAVASAVRRWIAEQRHRCSLAGCRHAWFSRQVLRSPAAVLRLVISGARADPVNRLHHDHRPSRISRPLHVLPQRMWPSVRYVNGAHAGDCAPLPLRPWPLAVAPGCRRLGDAGACSSPAATPAPCDGPRHRHGGCSPSRRRPSRADRLGPRARCRPSRPRAVACGRARLVRQPARSGNDREWPPDVAQAALGPRSTAIG